MPNILACRPFTPDALQEPPRKAGVYVIRAEENPSKAYFYVGCTKELHSRLKKHGGGKGGEFGRYPEVTAFIDQVFTYGWDSLSWNILESWDGVTSLEFRAVRETLWLQMFSVFPLVNKVLVIKPADRRRKSKRLPQL